MNLVSQLRAAASGSRVDLFAKRLRPIAQEIIDIQEIYLRKAPKPERPRVSAAEHRAEEFDLQGQNIPAELKPLWRRIGKSDQFTPNERTDRWELFIEYAAEHPEEVYEAAERDAVAWLSMIESEQMRQQVPGVPF